MVSFSIFLIQIVLIYATVYAGPKHFKATQTNFAYYLLTSIVVWISFSVGSLLLLSKSGEINDSPGGNALLGIFAILIGCIVFWKN